MVYTVIALPADLSDAERARAVSEGPPAMDVVDEHARRLEATGWAVERQLDLSTEFLATAERALAEWQARRDEMVELFGAEEYERRLESRRGKRRVIAEGLLRRTLVVAVAG